ncbi:MAG TPA: hypothetical protein VFP01_08125, partial [Propionibacteriaceae bacterium]|nr:hypothetical protein [Propionibacteriaceae bacterium]
RVKNFATGDGSPWLAWRGAALSGKTGLMATIATQGIPRVDIVPFLIVRNQVGENDRQAFLSRTLPFLAHIVGDRYTSRSSDPAAARDIFSTMLRRAGAAAISRERQVLILIDGLDEDPALVGAQFSSSVAGLLPKHLPMGVRVMVSARPNPPIPFDVPQEHPLRDPTTWVPLDPSPHAAGAVDPSDVRDLMSTKAGYRVAAFLAAAGGPLTAADLAMLTRHTLPKIEALLSHRPSRILIPVPIKPTVIGYRLGHDTVDIQVVTSLNPALRDHPLEPDTAEWQAARVRALARYRNRIHELATKYAQENWPSDTPVYFMGDAYPLSTVADRHRGETLILVLTDSHRRDRLLEENGSDYPLIQQIRAVAEELVKPERNDVDLYVLVAC